MSLPVQALSPAGRCRTFDAAGDGYGRGEGCAVTVLQPGGPGGLPAHAILTATATNQVLNRDFPGMQDM